METRAYFIFGDLEANPFAAMGVGLAMALCFGPSWNMWIAMFIGIAIDISDGMMNLTPQLSRCVGPDMNRPTVKNLQAAGSRIEEVQHVVLDINKTISARA